MRSTLAVTIWLLALLLFHPMLGQDTHVHPQSNEYEWPEDPAVREKLDRWQDLKFGMIIHWGLYAVPGIIESWELCSEDWLNRPDSMSYCQYKEWYWGLHKTFNPTGFGPEQWARAARKGGMKYLVFTTKHHDGFNLFDTQQTNYKITSGPFSNHPKANVAKHVFEAFRNEGLMVGAYFSKPDWHSPYFWWDKYATPNRNVNYDIRKHPDRWNKFKTFTYNQINELTSDYGALDILWLDGGWVRPKETVNEEVLSWGAPVPEWDQNIDIPKIAAMARKNQPGILIVDRTVHGPYENYQTPERSVPEKQLPFPWESCIPLANNWGYVPNDELKPATQILHSLIEIVAKGGSLLLGIGPKPDGTLRENDMQILDEIGHWLETNGKALYGTRTVSYYQEKNTFFTKDKNGTLYAIVCIPEGDTISDTVEWTTHIPQKNSPITLISNNTKVDWVLKGDKVVLNVPKNVRKKMGSYPALAFEFKPDTQP